MTQSFDAELLAKRGSAHIEGRHSVSAFNFRPEVTQEFDFPKPLALIDSTIRKVIYTAGVRPTIKELLKIGEILQEIGVKDESLNMWWWGDDRPNDIEYETVKAFAQAGFSFRVNVFLDTLVGDGRTPSTNMKRSVDMLAGLGIGTVNPGLLEPADAEAEKRQAEEFAAFAEYAKRQGLGWTLTVAHCGRRDFDKLIRGSNVAIANGAERIDLMDSTSTLSPEAMKLFTRTYRSLLDRPTPITMHHHDDFGMATAGTVAAVTAGASPDVALNGVSYRSGFAALEEVVLALDVLYGLDTGIRLDRLQWAADELARIMDLPIPPLKPVVGAHQFLRDSPGEIMRMLQAPDMFPPSGCSINPAMVGSRMRWVWGKQSTDGVIREVAAMLGVKLPAEELSRIRADLNRRLDTVSTFPKWLPSEAVFDAVRASAQHRGAA